MNVERNTSIADTRLDARRIVTNDDRASKDDVEHVDTVVVGGGQAGLAVGKLLAEQGIQFVILDAEKRTGDTWRKRWDSLMLFTPARFNKLPGMRFPASGDSFVTKDQMADFLEQYSKRFQLPIRHDSRVTSLSKQDNAFVLDTTSGRFVAQRVVVAMSSYREPNMPTFAKSLDPEIVQVHSSEYRNPSQLKEGNVLIVGAGNSGADIGLELAANHTVYMSGPSTGHIPFRIERAFGRSLGIRLVRFLGHNVLSTSTPIGRRIRPKMLHLAGPLVRVKPIDLQRAGVQRVDRTVSVSGGWPVIEGDSEPLHVSNVVFCTGFKPAFPWINLPVFDEAGDPKHIRGVVPDEPGLYFVGLHFLHAATSGVIAGVSRDARHVVRQLVRNTATEPSAQ